MGKKRSYLHTGATWVFECRCRKCGTAHEYCAQDRQKQTWADFFKQLCDRDMKEPYVEFCEKCNTMTLQDLIAFSPKPANEA